MTLEELAKDQELFDVCMKEVEEKVRGGMNPGQAKFEVFKAHGAEFDEDAVKAKLVDKMELSEEELQHVTGGSGWCGYDHNCYYAYHHDGKWAEPCTWDHECGFIYNCDQSTYRYLRRPD